MVGCGTVAPPPTPDQDLMYGLRWSFVQRTRTYIRSGVGFYRYQLDLLRADQVAVSLYTLIFITK